MDVYQNQMKLQPQTRRLQKIKRLQSISVVSKFAETVSTTKTQLRKLIISLCASVQQALRAKVITT